MNYHNLIKHLKVKNDEIKNYILNIKEPNFINKFLGKEMYFELINILQFLEIKFFKHNEIIILDQFKDEFFIIPLKGSIDILKKKKFIEDKSKNILKSENNILKEIKDFYGEYHFDRFYDFTNIFEKKKYNFKYDPYKTFKEGKSFGNMLKYKNNLSEDEIKDKYIIISNNINYLDKNIKYKTPHNLINYNKDSEFNDMVIVGIISKKENDIFENKFEKYEFSRKIKYIKNIFPNSNMFKLNKLLEKFKTQKFKKNDIIFKLKQEIKYIYFIKNGKLLLKDLVNINKKQNIDIKVRLISKNSIIGVNELLKNHNKYFFSGVCHSEKWSVYAVSFKDFVSFISYYPYFLKLLKKYIINFNNYIKNKKKIINIRKNTNVEKINKSINIDNFQQNVLKIQSQTLKNFMKNKRKIYKNNASINKIPKSVRISTNNRIKSLDNNTKNYNGKLNINNKQFFKIKFLKSVRNIKNSTNYVFKKYKNNLKTRIFNSSCDKSKSISILNKYINLKKN